MNRLAMQCELHDLIGGPGVVSCPALPPPPPPPPPQDGQGHETVRDNPIPAFRFVPDVSMSLRRAVHAVGDEMKVQRRIVFSGASVGIAGCYVVSSLSISLCTSLAVVSVFMFGLGFCVREVFSIDLKDGNL